VSGAARVKAQAKINLFLRVYAPDGSGFHPLATAFHALDLADDVVVRVDDSGERRLRCSGTAMPASGLGPDERNLAFRAAEAFRARTGWPRGFDIEVVKHIPVGGGLGGGSSDAAAVLRALNTLSPAPLDAAALHAIAATLGSDVAFFASGYVAALGRGRGEVLTPLPPLPAMTALLVVPDFGIATADAYRWLDEEHAFSSSEPSSAAAPGSGNDFEPVMERRFPVLRRYREQLLEAGAQQANLSGSGSTVFGLFEREPALRNMGGDALVIPTRTATRVVPVEVLE
jgi:4-diphosphocytidyl-2-C-methyl-D-erythritol kinase